MPSSFSLRHLTVLLCAAVAMAASLGVIPQGHPAPAVGQKAPSLKLSPPGGGIACSLEQFKGKPVLIVFWATWCGYCKAEMPALKKLQDDYTSLGLRVVAVAANTRETDQDVAAYQISEQIPFIVLWDGDGKAAQDWGVTAFPTNILIDGDGVIRGQGHAMDEAFVGLVRETVKKK